MFGFSLAILGVSRYAGLAMAVLPATSRTTPPVDRTYYGILSLFVSDALFRFGLNDAMLPGEDDLYVEYFDSTLMVLVRGHMGRRGSITRCISFHAKHPRFTRIPSSPLLISLAVVTRSPRYMIAQSTSSTLLSIYRAWITHDLIT